MSKQKAVLMMKQADELLVQKIRKGNQAASQKLYERHESYWFCLCLRYGRNREEAQDIFQEGVIKVFQVLDKFDTKRATFRAWSNKVIINEALKFLKKYQWQAAFDNLENAQNETGEMDNIVDIISAKELIELVQKLPLGYRLVFNMYEIEGYSHKEIATTLSVSVGTSKSQLSKAKKMLRAKLELLYGT